MKDNPMQKAHDAPRCGAKTRMDHPCRSPAMSNGRCRMHGGKSTGAPRGNKNALKHGRYTTEAIAAREEAKDLLKDIRQLISAQST